MKNAKADDATDPSLARLKPGVSRCTAMSDEFAGPGHVTGAGVANKESPAQCRNNQPTRRIQRAVAQAHGARDQFSGVMPGGWVR